MTDCDKLIPSAVPQSDLELAQQMDDLIWKTAGINLENWAGQQDKQTSTLHLLIERVGQKTWAIFDNGSTNGTYINDIQIKPMTRVEVPSGTQLQIGETKIVLP
jgi:pSer/pThr/pTyr-binding forkhead associated (FHA) protein